MTKRPVVILTALNLEYLAVREKLVNLWSRPHPRGTRFEIGQLRPGGRQIVLGLVGKGNQPAGILAERAINSFEPGAVLFVGVGGALHAWMPLGDIVVATHVYAYHGGTSEDSGLKSRPRVWETSHAALEAARHLARTDQWFKDHVHFGPVAAGEVVLDSKLSSEARWIRKHYNDALAIEMEAAGVAQAGHLNEALPVVVIRGMSDRADGTKEHTDQAQWQQAAAGGAATFALRVAAELEIRDKTQPHDATGNHTMRHTTNIARGGATVGIQAGHIQGPVTVSQSPAPPAPAANADLGAELRELREQLRKSRDSGQLDVDTYEEAEAELAIADESLPAETPERRRRLLMALRRLRGLIDDIADLASKLTTIIALVQGRP